MTERTPSVTLDRLFATILRRQAIPGEGSYTASLFAAGTAKIAQKVGEEAVETIIEAMRGDRDRLISESADLVYHLLVLWADAGLAPADVWTELDRRHRGSHIAATGDPDAPNGE